MQTILSNISDPSWWFNGIFFIIIGLAIAWLIKLAPKLLKSFARKTQAKKLQKIKRERWCALTVQYQIGCAQARFLVFIFTCFTYISWLAYESIKIIFHDNFILGIFLTSPIYIVEAIWLFRDLYVKELIKRRRKLRITRT